MKKLITFLILLLLAVPASASQLWEYGNFEERAILAIENGLVSYTSEYTGSFEQNIALLDILENYSSEPLLGSYVPSTGYSQRLTSSISSSDTTIPVSSTNDRDGIQLPLSPNNKGYFNIEPGTTREESVVCTGISGNSLTGCTRGLEASSDSEVGSTTLQFSHNAGTRIIMTNIAQFFGNYMDLLNDQTASGTKTFTDNPFVPNPTLSGHAVNKSYVDSVAQQGGATSTESVVGIIKLADQTTMASSTHDSDEPAALYSLYSTSSAPVSGIYIPVTQNNGNIDNDFLDNGASLIRTGDTTLASTTFTASTTWDILPEYTSDPIGDNEAARKKYVDDSTIKQALLSASENLKISLDNLATTQNNTYVKVKEYRILNIGDVRIKFDLAASAGAAAAYGRVYINDIAVGTERVTSSASFTTFTEDFSVDAGDFVQIYAREEGGGVTQDAEVENFRTFYDVTITDGYSIITN